MRKIHDTVKTNIKAYPEPSTLPQEGSVTFDQVYALYWKPLYRTALRILNDEQIAEDIVQDTFVRLWEHWDTMIHINIKGWLFTTSYRLVLKSLKQLKSHESIDKGNFPSLFAPEADASLHLRQLQKQVDTCIDSLPEKCRKVYTMSRNEYLSVKCIALELGISPKTVEGHVTVALKRIRESIGAVIAVLFTCFL